MKMFTMVREERMEEILEKIQSIDKRIKWGGSRFPTHFNPFIACKSVDPWIKLAEHNDPFEMIDKGIIYIYYDSNTFNLNFGMRYDPDRDGEEVDNYDFITLMSICNPRNDENKGE